MVRAQHRLDNLELIEPIKMDETLIENLSPPRFENGKPLLVVGLSERYDSQTSAGIPAQWQRFGPHLGHIPGQLGNTAYGVCYNSDDEGSIDYMSGVEVGDFSRVPEGFARLRIAPQRYAVFFHADHISSIRRAWYTIWNKWIPESEYQAIDAPGFELYDERFDPRTGTGGFEIWIPIR
jgi:AraC family transcriptional regulator